MIKIDLPEMPTNCFDCWIRRNMGCKFANESGWLIDERDSRCPLEEVEYND